MDLIVYSHDIQKTRQRMIKIALRKHETPVKGFKYVDWRDEGLRRPVLKVARTPLVRKRKKTLAIVRGPTEEEIQSIPGFHVLGYVVNSNYQFKAAGEVFMKLDDNDNPTYFTKSGEELYVAVVGSTGKIGLFM